MTPIKYVGQHAATGQRVVSLSHALSLFLSLYVPCPWLPVALCLVPSVYCLLPSAWRGQRFKSFDTQLLEHMWDRPAWGWRATGQRKVKGARVGNIILSDFMMNLCPKIPAHLHTHTRTHTHHQQHHQLCGFSPGKG